MSLPFVHSPEVQRMLQQAARGERAEEAEAEERAEQWAARCRTLASDVVRANEQMLLAGDVEARRAETAERRAREERITRAEDHRFRLIMAGARPHTIGEALAAAAGQVS